MSQAINLSGAAGLQGCPCAPAWAHPPPRCPVLLATPAWPLSILPEKKRRIGMKKSGCERSYGRYFSHQKCIFIGRFCRNRPPLVRRGRSPIGKSRRSHDFQGIHHGKAILALPEVHRSLQRGAETKFSFPPRPAAVGPQSAATGAGAAVPGSWLWRVASWCVVRAYGIGIVWYRYCVVLI